MSTAGDMPPGARWARAALQVNPFGYVGRAAPSQTFADEASYNDALLAECEALGIELIGITDHWTVNTARSLVDAARVRGIVALPGFEANSSEGVHLLVLFDSDTDFADINAAIGACGPNPGAPNGTTGKPFAEILEAMADRGALVVPAHANVANGGMMTGRTGPPLVKMVQDRHLHAVAVCPGSADATEQHAICTGTRPYDRAHPLSVIHADDVNSPSTLSDAGATTWFKGSGLCLASLKLAVRTPATRVATRDPVASARPLIQQISWTGGFLDGVTIPFAADLTALIGGRGTGKSTIIESIRYVLGIEPFSESARRDHASIVSGVLRSGTTVRMEVETVSPSPRRYTIERSVPNPPIVRDSSGTKTDLRASDVIGMVEVFGQHELADLAHDKASVARMLERFAGTGGPSRDHVQLLSALKENRESIARAEKQRDALDKELSDIPRLQDHVDQYIATDLPTRLSDLQRLTQDEAIFAEGAQRVVDAGTELIPLLQGRLAAATGAAFDGVAESPQAETLGRVSAALEVLRTRLAEIAVDAQTALDASRREIEAAQADWTTATGPQRDGHAEVLRQLVEDGHDPDRYLTTTAALNTLKAKIPRRDTIAAGIATLLQERSRLLGELAAHETRRAEELNDAIRAANTATGGVVIVRPIAAPDRQHIKAVIEQHTRGARTQIMAAVEATEFSPRAFVEAIRSGVAGLEDMGIRGAQAASLVAAGEPLLRELEELSVGQAVDVRLDVAAGAGPRDFRNLDELSKGQRATALLLLLLGASTAPLIIDQPEDDLDNRFVYDGIVQRLRELKGSRQVIASTHNANVPVLGDAELIVALEGDGQHGWPVEDGIGSLDDAPIRALAENLLEGGPAAFNARQHLYGF